MSDTKVLYGEEEAAEVIRAYDSDTGSELNESIDGVVKNEENYAVFEAEALLAMKQTSGWAIVEEFIKANVEVLTEQVIVEEDFEKIRRIQEFLKAYHKLTYFIEGKIAEGLRFKEDPQP